MKPKYKIGDTVYLIDDNKIRSQIDHGFLEPLFADIAKINGIVKINLSSHIEYSDKGYEERKKIIRYAVTICFLKGSPTSTIKDEHLLGNKQELIDKVKDIIIEMESNIQKVRNELGIE